MTAATTIKVPTELRDRIAARAHTHHVTQAEVIAEALDAVEQREFWASIQEGYARLRADPQAWEDYAAERDGWVDASLIDQDKK